MPDLTDPGPERVMDGMTRTPKKPAAFSIGDIRVNAVRGPDAASPLWYWRAMRPVGAGKRKTVWTGRASRRDAQQAVARLLADGEDMREGSAAEVEIATVADLLAYWIGAMDERAEVGDLTVSSAQAYRRCARQLLPVLGHVHLSRLDSPHLATYRDRQLAAGRAPKSIINDLTALKCAWRWGQDRGLCDARTLARPKVKPRPVRNRHTPTRDEFWAAVDAVERRGFRPEAGQILRFLAATGMRSGEACALEVDAVSLTRAEAEVRGGKTPRVVPLGGPALEIVALAIGDRARGKVWPGPTDSLKKLLNRALAGIAWADLGLTPFSPHGIRRMVVIELLAAGVDPAVEARIIGHSPEVAMRYYREVRRAHMDDALALAALGQREPGNVVPLRRRV